MSKIPVSVGILTFNSGETLERALESVKDFAEIIICDGGSTDSTLDIARTYDARIIEQDSKFKNEDGTLKDYSGVRNQCIEEANFSWFLYIDSDETIDDNLAEEIRGIVSDAENKNLVYGLRPRIIYNGKRIEYSSNYPGWQKRFFNIKSGARFIKPVHERIAFNEDVVEGRLNSHWYYYVEDDFSLEKLTKYAKMEADLFLIRKKHPLIRGIIQRLIIVLKITVKSLRNYIFHGFKKSMPPRAELRRIRYNLLVIKFLLWPKKMEQK